MSFSKLHTLLPYILNIQLETLRPYMASIPPQEQPGHCTDRSWLPLSTLCDGQCTDAQRTADLKQQGDIVG